MRGTLFRGKNSDTSEWWYGDLFRTSRRFFIRRPYAETYYEHDEVISETVGECSFVPDKNGVMMFEGDIVTGLFLFGMSVNAVVTFQDGAFGLEWYRGNAKTFNAFTSICNVEYEVIGNIHDNPELLKCD